MQKFQSTRPVWGATWRSCLKTAFLTMFQSTRPVWGATSPEAALPVVQTVSIHAPRVGRDWSSRTTPLKKSSFNPRAPCGARPAEVSDTCANDEFQSTRPVWGATHLHGCRHRRPDVSIHAPRVGRDPMRLSIRFRMACFNPRAPCGARLSRMPMLPAVRPVSIHAPRVGRDRDMRAWASRSCSFNPRAPCGARHGCAPRAQRALSVSIHAPRVGRDSARFPSLGFLSGFNPRAPCGARH